MSAAKKASPKKAEPETVRIVLDATVAGTGLDTLLDRVVEVLESSGEVDVSLLWQGPRDQPVGSIPYPRTPPEAEVKAHEEALAQIEAESASEPEAE